MSYKKEKENNQDFLFTVELNTHWKTLCAYLLLIIAIFCID